ncbi:MAG: ATP-grasp domain-containing protein [Deltaproteobacteria bacterium]|nr:ATP-grasp domain-containing protein [bacterium]MCB9477117.1 ATP-grasp domain-containing protein [Deltaproteobacteria bacterium]MCB9479159.1 ATP-grasp domain-containing protein [Deltaproteobacteria bacterium]MCB9489170.1 ATP-grasp domain-containing protein [Deltaproteobacteria bacterium]
MSLTIAVTGLNATDNPGPGVPVIRAIREGALGDCRIVGLAYDALDPGIFMDQVADEVYLMPYPSQGMTAVFERLAYIHERTPIDVLIPCLDAELPAYVRMADQLREMGIRMFIPDEGQLGLRSKANFPKLRNDLKIVTPETFTVTSPTQLANLDENLKYPVMVKGQFYDAHIAYSRMDVERLFYQVRAQWGAPVIVQEYVDGEEFCVTALGDGQGGLVGSVAMRKMQLTDKGKAWGGITIRDAKLDAFVRDTMAKLKWRGPCEMEVMRAKGGKLYLLEINPRFPAWVYLTVGAGRNLPWATVQLAMGESLAPFDPAAPGVMFLRHSFDRICRLSDFETLQMTGEIHRAAEVSP